MRQKALRQVQPICRLVQCESYCDSGALQTRGIEALAAESGFRHGG
jgi:hypothetical protein